MSTDEKVPDMIREFNEATHEEIYECPECGFSVVMPVFFRKEVDKCGHTIWRQIRHFVHRYIDDVGVVRAMDHEYIPTCPFHHQTEMKTIFIAGIK